MLLIFGLVSSYSEINRVWGVVALHQEIGERARELALYIVEHNTTVRAAAKKYRVSKSTVHKDVAERLMYIDRSLALKVKAVLEKNKAERHIRGGLATKEKYRQLSDLKR